VTKDWSTDREYYNPLYTYFSQYCASDQLLAKPHPHRFRRFGDIQSVVAWMKYERHASLPTIYVISDIQPKS